MTAASAITSVRTTQGSKFIAHKMFTAGTAMPAFAEYPDLVNKITLLQFVTFTMLNEFSKVAKIPYQQVKTLTMRYILLMLAFTILTSENCNKKKKQDPGKETTEVVVSASHIPNCIRLKIDSIRKLP